MSLRLRLLFLLAFAAKAAFATAPTLDAESLAAELHRRPNVLLGEVHDNRVQHAVRVEALVRVLESGLRPALAFEQIDRERQQAVDEARRLALPADQLLDRVIDAAAAPQWDWSLYRPYVQLALQFELPIVAANLSRGDAMKAARSGYGALFDAPVLAKLGLEDLPADVIEAHVRAVDEGHCRMLPADTARQLARAQIARDATLAEAIRPHLGSGVVLLTGNGHARNDVGVPYFLTADERRRTWTIGLLEDEHADDAAVAPYDAVFITPTHQRTDPCAALRKR